jgi:hypothetical protein
MNESIRTINPDVAQAEFGARGQGIAWAVVGSGVESSLAHFSKHANLALPEGEWSKNSCGIAVILQ